MRQSMAFTLVELLVVVGIIALLIGILLPVLGKARQQAYTVKCASNMRSAAQALLFYTTESKGWLPGPWTSGYDKHTGTGDQMALTDTSADVTPLQNMDWVSPTLGKTFRWPENDYDRLKAIFNLQLYCPTNSLTFQRAEPVGSLPVSNDVQFTSYSAVEEFHAFPSREQGGVKPPISTTMYDPALTAPSGYVPKISRVGPAAKKVYLVEGGRYLTTSGSQASTMTITDTSFNSYRYQVSGGNFMIGGPFTNWANTPYQLSDSVSNQNYTASKPSKFAANFAWRHNGKMNLAFFDGHVEARDVQNSIQVDLYVPPGTIIKKSSLTFDPKDSDGQQIMN